MLNKKLLIPILLLLSSGLCFAEASKSDIKWTKSDFGDLHIKIEPHKGTIQTPNMAMQFKEIYQMLRQNIPWMLPGEINVEVFQNKRSFLQNNRELTEDWSGAFFDPDQNIIVMYDAPHHQVHMMKKFAHELTHLFFENTFNPPKSQAPKKEPPIWLNEGLAVNMEDIAKTPNGDVWDRDLVVINIFSDGEHSVLRERKRTGGLTQKERDGFRKFSVSNKVVFFEDFGEFMDQSSYDRAVAAGRVDDWYLQAYAMVRFLFRPNKSPTPSKRMQFEQFTKLLSTYTPKKDEKGKLVFTEDGRKIMSRPNEEEALKQAYKYRDIRDFEEKFWKWITMYQALGRRNIKRELQEEANNQSQHGQGFNPPHGQGFHPHGQGFHPPHGQGFNPPHGQGFNPQYNQGYGTQNNYGNSTY